MKTISRYIMTLALLITAVGGAWAQTETLLTTITPTGNATYSETKTGVVTVTLSNVRRYLSTYGWLWGSSGSVTVEAKEGYTITQCVFKQNSKTPVTITTSPFAITFNERGRCVQNDDMDGVTSIEVYGYSNAPAGPEVTITGTSTEGQQAEFDMPQYDVTATYTIKRDLSVETQVTVGDDHSAQPRYRVQKQGNTFQPVGMATDEVMALFKVHDQIENEDLNATDDYTVQIYAVDVEGQPTGDAITFQNFTYAPGQYIVKAQGQGNYVGQTTESNVFTLYEGYEVEIKAGEYATCYSETDNLKLEDGITDAKIYTIRNVTATTVLLSDEISVAAAGTPILIHNTNSGTEVKKFLLIPTNDAATNVTAYSGFKGTASATTIPASTDDTNNYALNGLQFVWVKTDLPIAPNKCWLQVSAASARALNIVFGGDTTGISTTNYTNSMNGEFYDLNGRKLSGKPTKKGVYIQNGKKVVIK